MPRHYPQFKAFDGKVINYVVVEPPDFDATHSYPALLALPPGGQTMELVEWGLDAYWEAEAEKRGWLVISPEAPDGLLYFGGSERYIPYLLDHIVNTYTVSSKKFHLAGISNGGRSAFRIALNHPEWFCSLLALPGFPPEAADFERLERLKGLHIAMFVGQSDELWVKQMQRTKESLRQFEIDAMLEIVAEDGHVIRSLERDNTRLYDLLDSWR